MTSKRISARHSVGRELNAVKIPLRMLTSLVLTLISSRCGSRLSTSCHIERTEGQEHNSNSSVKGG